MNNIIHTRFLDAARDVLLKEQKFLTPLEITNIAFQLNILKSDGKTPTATMSSNMLVDLRDNKDSIFIKSETKPVKYSLKSFKIENIPIIENKDKPGFIYIMENPYYKTNDIYKIGFSINPEQRAIQLSSATGVIGKFHLIKSFPVLNMKKYESIIHNILDSRRYSQNKEFFELPYKDLLHIIDGVIELMNIVNSKV